jgi:putative ABC transport system permease protein
LTKVLGAKSRDVFVQSLVEAIMLVVAALGLAMLAAEIAMPIVNEATSFTLDMPYTTSPTLWATLVAIVGGVGMLAGGYPAYLLARIRPVQMLAGGGGRSGSRVLRRLLVGGQFTIACILLILVGVMFMHNREMRALGVNAAADPIVVIDSTLPRDETTRDALVAALAADPGVLAVSATAVTPWALDQLNAVAVSRTGDANAQATPYLLNLVDYDFFTTVDTPLLAGRAFARDRGSDRVVAGNTPAENATPQRAVVDRSFARRFGWTDPADAVGKAVFRRVGNQGLARPIEIIGVVEDVPYKLVSYGMGSASIFLLNPGDTRMLLVRVARQNLPATLAHIDRTWDEFSPSIPIKRRFMDELFDQNFEIFEIFNHVFAGLAAFAVLVACIGLFGSATYATGRRVREIGVRKTLGASSDNIVRMLLWDFSKPVLVANAIAWPLGFGLMQAYFSMFVFRAALTVVPFAASLVLTLAVAWLAVAAQSYAAARVQPGKVLRSE